MLIPIGVKNEQFYLQHKDAHSLKKKKKKKMLLFYHYFFSFNSVTIKREKKEYIKINGDHVDKPGMIFPVSVKYKLFVLNKRTPRYFPRYF